MNCVCASIDEMLRAAAPTMFQSRGDWYDQSRIIRPVAHAPCLWDARIGVVAVRFHGKIRIAAHNVAFHKSVAGVHGAAQL